ncbi:MAG: hypothetical protein FJ033_10320 [Chloroflexi bacterium]|nr:hypothetical protein [Chloroflexota bacterium]
MPGLSVEAAWREILPRGTELVAGAVGLDRLITWPVTLRARAPALPHLKGGELAFVAVETLAVLDPPQTLLAVIRSMALKQVSGVAVVGPISPEAISLAESIGLPILALPAAHYLPELEQAVSRAIVDRRNLFHQRSQDLFRELTEAAIEGGGVETIVSKVARFTRRTIVLESPTFEVRHVGFGEPAEREDFFASLAAQSAKVERWAINLAYSASEPPTMRLAIEGDRERIVAPIAGREGTLGYLSILGRRGQLEPIDEMAVSRAAAACAADLARERAVLDVEDRLEADLIEALISGGYGSVASARARARRLRLDVDQRFGAIVFGVDGGGSDGSAALMVRRARDRIIAELDRRTIRAPTGIHERVVVSLVPVADDGRSLRTLADDLRSAVSEALGVALTAGIGRIHEGVDGLRLAFQEAEGALQVGGRIRGEGRTHHYADLGLYRLLLALRSSADLEAYYGDLLGPLVEYDQRNAGDLVRTLDAYFACLGSPTDAAEMLGVHRNTLMYRLKRIEEIARIDLSDAEARLALHLAIRVADVLGRGVDYGRIAQSS